MKISLNFIFRFLLHPFLWILAFLFKVVVMVTAMESGPTPFEGNEQQIIALYLGTLINAFLFYSTAYLFVPHFLLKKKRLLFWIFSSISFFGLSAFYYWRIVNADPFQNAAGSNSILNNYNLQLYFGFHIFFNLFFIVLAFFYRKNLPEKPYSLLPHLFFWFGFYFLLLLLGLQWGPMALERGNFLIPVTYGMVINVILFYFNSYVAIPKFLIKKNDPVFWLYSCLLLIGFSLIECTIDYWYFYYTDTLKAASETYGEFEDNGTVGAIIINSASTTIFNIFFWSLAFLYRWPIEWKNSELQKQQLIQDKLAAELDLLKSQLNPHFLFNGINSIYHLIGEDDDAAKRVLLKLSDLLRYQLYECNET